MRKSGWYWVKVINRSKWGCYMWNGISWEGERGDRYSDELFDVVGPRIPTPDEPLQTAPDVAEPKSPTPKESWWAGYRAGKGLPANTPRQDAIAAPDMPVLTEALRQYRNNDGSKLVFGYDKLLVDRHVAGLVEALEAVMEFGCDPKSNRGKWAQEKAESVLAAYHKGDES